MRFYLIIGLLFFGLLINAQVPVVLPSNPSENSTNIALNKNDLIVTWPLENGNNCQLAINLDKEEPLFRSIAMGRNNHFKAISSNVDPVFILNSGSRTLQADKGWTIFFDKAPNRPYTSHVLNINKREANITKNGNRTIISIGDISAPNFDGFLEITIYNGIPLLNIAAVITTQKDSTAILFDAGLVSDQPWKTISYSDITDEFVQTVSNIDTSTNSAVKYRTIIAQENEGSIAVFPPPHQYFYPLDEAFNLKSVWHGPNYRGMVSRYGLGIRHEPEGDHRYVPWFNAPPGSKQRLNFFCLIGGGQADSLLEDVKKYTHSDQYVPLKGHRTMASHFHNEFIMNVVMKNEVIPTAPEFVDVFKKMGVDIVHLGEFHYTAHPKGPDEIRLKELSALFEQCERLSDEDFLLLPGEEPNEFLGGHWMSIFPKPVNWIMSNKSNKPFVSDDKVYGKVYRIKNKMEMQQLLESENGLVWTAHPRIKGSTGYPDAYKNEDFFKSQHFLGGAWKPMPADLSSPKLGTRVLDLLDDMNNWGDKKKIIAEADLFTVTMENEMYAHMNINYLQLDTLPKFKDGWAPVLNAMTTGKYFSTTGEVLIPNFSINGKGSGETIKLNAGGEAKIHLNIDWTFPLNFLEVVSGDGQTVFRERLDLSKTGAFGSEEFQLSLNLVNRTWARVEVWDIAANGAFTQTIYFSK
ncbi:CehA/McbA family metallohydrolase domain-containing protein [Arenibacter troitsensis]|uniref:Uncharacterized protein n=1 Tax=Arenibacter troitsensis TaxID=188872 RepID=A0A1X7LGP4_9FLAO|nr:hypothetical protein [Arenibacter troitsensis]SMG52412.1 hypothetical protein SAMN03080602_04211 [Arenibacter troitsensis]